MNNSKMPDQKTPNRAPPPRRGLYRILRSVLLGTTMLTVSACSAVLFHTMNATTSAGRVMSKKGITFEPEHGQKLDVYWPAHARNAPVVVFFYGGAWQDGRRQLYTWAGETLARHGLVVIVPDYRKYPQVTLDGFMHDGAQAVAWAYRHAADYGGDTSHFFLMGHSAGAHIAALLATDDQWLQTVGMTPKDITGFIGLAGPYDFLPLKEQVYRNILGRTHAEAEKSQPVRFVNGDEPPMLLMQGLDDHTVAPKNARSMARAMHAHDEEAELRLFTNVNHAWLLLSLWHGFRGKAPTLRDTLRFIKKHDPQAQLRMIDGDD